MADTKDNVGPSLDDAAIYEDLRKRARRLLADNDGGSLNTTALVHDAYLKLSNGNVAPENKSHFFHIASTAMRQILVDHARYKHAQLRDQRKLVTFDSELVAPEDSQLSDVIALDDALTRLRSEGQALITVVELHFFGGLSFPEIAELQGCSLSTIERQWRTARAWLHTHMRDSHE